MVSSITSLTGNGLKDWLIQRLTAVYLAIYSVLSIVIWIGCSPWNYSKWIDLFHTSWFQVATALALFTILLHAWIGIWTVTTDYIKSTALRLMVQSLVMFVLLSQLIGGFMMIWGY
ncbi:MAG: succinate dehydrogenase, hydrophobic membrane anchor protein [Legionellaceae bacterium]|nr:succinate dehydrogenase, hydrophobic membrane anchor protein [Legionellaceae bacterium]